MKVRVDPNHIHHFKQPILDANRKPTGEVKDVLQLDVQFPKYPQLPTYGLRIDFPITKQKVLDAIKAKARQAKAQVDLDIFIKGQLGTDILEFDVEV
ncbi:MAG: hypothetical protein HWN68_19075 [Desulfobacterales bacterium]|nr:hypothetical protein [Desulfobacterales bacterium]